MSFLWKIFPSRNKNSLGIKKNLYLTLKKDKWVSVDILPKYNIIDILLEYYEDMKPFIVSEKEYDNIYNKELFADYCMSIGLKFYIIDSKCDYSLILLSDKSNIYNLLKANNKYDIFLLTQDKITSNNSINKLSSILMYQSEYTNNKNINLSFSPDIFFPRFLLLEQKKYIIRYSQKYHCFQNITMSLYNDVVIFKILPTKNKNNNNKNNIYKTNVVKIININSIKNIEKNNEIVYNDNNIIYHTFIIEFTKEITTRKSISNSDNNNSNIKEKKYIFMVRELVDANKWINAIKKQVNLSKAFNKSNEYSNSTYNILNKNNNSSKEINQIIFTLKGILSLAYTRKIFLEFIDNKLIKNAFNLICAYKENITTKNYFDAWLNLEEIYKMIIENKNIFISDKEFLGEQFYNDFINKISNIKSDCKNILSNTQKDDNLNNKNKSKNVWIINNQNLKRKDNLNKDLSSALIIELFDDYYSKIIDNFFNEKYEQLVNEHNEKFYTRLNWTLGDIEQDKSQFSDIDFFNIEDCIKDLIVPYEK